MPPAPVHPDSTHYGAPSSPESHADQHARLFNHEIQDTEDTNAEILAAAAEAREFLAANPGLKRSDPARYRAARVLLSIKPLSVPTWPKPRKPRPSLPSRPSSSSSYDSFSRSTSSTRASSSPSLPAPVMPPAPQAAPHTAPRQSDALPHPTSAIAPASPPPASPIAPAAAEPAPPAPPAAHCASLPFAADSPKSTPRRVEHSSRQFRIPPPSSACATPCPRRCSTAHARPHRGHRPAPANLAPS